MQGSRQESFQKTPKSNRKLDDGTNKKFSYNDKKCKKTPQRKNFN